MKYIIDLDGTLMNDKLPNLDAVQFIDALKSKGAEFIIMTNAVRSRERIQERLEDAGIVVAKSAIMTPITAMNLYLKEKGYQRAWVIGSSQEKEQLEICLDSRDPEVVLFLDFEKEEADFSDMQKVYDLINAGIPVVSASRSSYYIKNGKRRLDTGAFVALFEAVAHINIAVTGKPSRDYFWAGIRALKTTPDQVTVIGDDWRTDILGAVGAGCHTVLLRSGKYHVGDESNCPSGRCVNHLMDVLGDDG